jgi:hypothetical protein
MPSRRRKSPPAGVIDEYAAILRAADALEQTLAYLAATKPRVWRRRVLRGCMAVSTSLRDHCEFAERLEAPWSTSRSSSAACISSRQHAGSTRS